MGEGNGRRAAIEEEKKKIEPHFDEEYVKSSFNFLTRWRFVNRYYDQVRITGIENLQRGRQWLAVSNHASMFDFILAGHAFRSNEVPFPTFVAGKNLDTSILDRVGLNFRRWGALFVDRDKILKGTPSERIAHLVALRETVYGLLDRGQNFFVFPGGTRSSRGKLFPPDDKVRAGFFDYVSDAKGGKPRDIDIVPVAVGYSRRVEPLTFWLVKRCRARDTLLRRIGYYGGDAAAFAMWPVFRKVGYAPIATAYLSFGKPLPLRELDRERALEQDRPKGEKLADYARERTVHEVRELYKGLRR